MISVIGGLKYGARRQHARVLGELLAGEVPGALAEAADSVALPDLVLPVPIAARRWRQRGFNQAADIAHWCARRLDLPVPQRAVTRRQETASLAGLDRHARQAAVAGMFACRTAFDGLRVAIVDDVLTTGATSTELARELLDNGARAVQLWAVARTPIRIG